MKTVATAWNCKEYSCSRVRDKIPQTLMKLTSSLYQVNSLTRSSTKLYRIASQTQSVSQSHEFNCTSSADFQIPSLMNEKRGSEGVIIAVALPLVRSLVEVKAYKFPARLFAVALPCNLQRAKTA